MELDTLFGEYHYSMNGIFYSSDLNCNGFLIDTNFMSSPTSSQPPSSDGDYSSDDGTSSNPILKHIGEMLMEEEDLEAKPCMLHDCLALQAAEKSLYDILVHPPNQFQNPHSPNSSTDSILGSDQYLAPNGPRAKKKHHRDEDLEERSKKQPAVSVSYGDIDLEMLDKVLLCGGGDETESKRVASTDKSKARMSRKGKKGGGGEGVDLWSLLTQCSQSVGGNDKRTSRDLLSQIRQHSSPHGDGLQRTAHYLANALEARLAGESTPPYSPLATSPADVLKAYQVYVTACPFRRMSHFYANRMILKHAGKASRLHIIDFGILYGYQWPCLIQSLSTRPGGPPTLRITGIELPQRGFRPAEETGRRLQSYCERFSVPFEYRVIARKWESIRYEDLRIERGETTVVNCLYRLKNIADETVGEDSPRDAVLRLIRSIKPEVFVHGVVNGTYNAPFFVTRFREALFHFSALFDMFEETIAREDEQRRVFEREVFARDAMNAVACEGVERVERPETYKQWQVRNARAGLTQLPLDTELLSRIKERARSLYHKDFVIHQEGHWMLQGWKGRSIYAISCWTTA